MVSWIALESLWTGLRALGRAGLLAAFVSLWVMCPTLAGATPDLDDEFGIIEKKEVQKMPDDLKAVVRVAEDHHKRGEHDKASVLLWKQVHRLDRPGILLLIDCHRARKEWADMARAANVLLGKDGKDDEALTALGEASLRRGKISEAKEALKKALEANKMFQPAYQFMAEIYEKNPYEQRLLYQDMVETFGPKPAFLTKLCSISTSDGDNEQGEQFCQQAIQSDPTIPDNHVNLGLIAKQKGEIGNSKKLLKAAAEKFKKSEFAQYGIAAHLEEEKNYLEAYEAYEACLTADPESTRCLAGVGSTAMQIQKYTRSHEAFKKACQKMGRKLSPAVRRAAAALRQRKEFDWSDKFETVAEGCSIR